MADAAFLRLIASRCRTLMESANRPDVVEQLRFWAEEFETEAAAAKDIRVHPICPAETG